MATLDARLWAQIFGGSRRVAAQLHCGWLVPPALKALYPPRLTETLDDFFATQTDRIMGIPIIEKIEMDPDEWALVDRDNRVLHRGRLRCIADPTA